MADDDSPVAPEVEMAFRAAHRELEAVCDDRVLSEERMTISQVIFQFPVVVDEANSAAAAQIGPLIGWRSLPKDDWEPVIALHDFDNDVHCVDGIELDRRSVEGLSGWYDSSLYQAARAYRRAAGWDTAPGEGGFWLLMLAPDSHSGEGEDERVHYSGNLVGFVIVHDRDEDGIYESVAHIWTASSWRRRKVAQRLLAEAQKRFSIVEVEGPYTEDGSAFLKACPIGQST